MSVPPEQCVHLGAVPDRRTAARGRRREGAGGAQAEPGKLPVESIRHLPYQRLCPM